MNNIDNSQKLIDDESEFYKESKKKFNKNLDNESNNKKNDNSNDIVLKSDSDEEIDDLLDNFLIDKEENVFDNNKKNVNFLIKEESNSEYSNIVLILKLFIILNLGFNNILLLSSLYYLYYDLSSKSLVGSITVLYYYIFGLIPTVCMIGVFCVYAVALNWDFISVFYDFTDLKIIKDLNQFKNNMYNSYLNIYNLESLKKIKNIFHKTKEKFKNYIFEYKLNIILFQFDYVLEKILILVKSIFKFLSKEMYLFASYTYNRFEKKIKVKKKIYFNNKLNKLKIPIINDKNLDTNMKRDLNNLLKMMNQTKDMMKMVSNKNL
jgi:hypothetical protein